MISAGWMADRRAHSRVYRAIRKALVRPGKPVTSSSHHMSIGLPSLSRRWGAVLVCALLVACGGGSKKDKTTPGGTGSGNQLQSTGNGTPEGGGPNGGVGASMPGDGTAGTDPGSSSSSGPEGAVTFPNLDPDPAQAKVQVDQQLGVAKQALMQSPPDAEGALRAAKQALAIDASNVDAAAYVAFAYYHKKQLDTAELVLDELFKRPTAKQNANVFYVYGLIYDNTNRPEQAVLAYRKAVELNPSFASAHVNLGVYQLRNKQYGEAQSTFERLTKEFGRTDAITLTSLGSAYRGRSGDYPVGSSERNQFILAAEAHYKRALSVNANYGTAYYNLGLLYLDADPFPSGGGSLDTLQRLNAAKGFLDQYKNMPGVDIKLYDERMKDVSRAIKREEKRRKKSK
jgi:tetratricopeptide (TPR) repeat protein